MAASGNIITDILKQHNSRKIIILSQITTLILGIVALIISLKVPNVLQLMLHSYSFMVSGLFIPVLAGIFLKTRSTRGAFWSMVTGGGLTLVLIIGSWDLPFELDANIFGIAFSALIYLLFHFTTINQKRSTSDLSLHWHKSLFLCLNLCFQWKTRIFWHLVRL